MQKKYAKLKKKYKLLKADYENLRQEVHSMNKEFDYLNTFLYEQNLDRDYETFKYYLSEMYGDSEPVPDYIHPDNY